MTEQVQYLYDLFVSYADADKEWVQGYLLDALTQAGVRCISESAFALGMPRLLEFERAVQQSQHTLLVLSPAYLSDGSARFTDLLAQSYGLTTASWPIIPLILHPVQLPPRLAMLEALDATDPAERETVLKHLCAKLQLPVPGPTPKPSCPYPGMGTFQYNDHSRFFGRDHYVQELVERLRLHPFLTIIGPSGSGKSSLVFAGLVPALRKSTHFLGSGEWLAWWLRPGEAPLAAEATPIGDNPAQGNQTVPALLTMQSNTKHVLLIVDQFEEVFTVTRVDAVPFQKALLQLAQKPHCYVVLTARADFYQDLMTSLLWPEIQAHRAEVLPLDNDGLRQAIVQPAEDVGVFVESALVERLVADAAGEPGIMPFIQETLVLLWERLERRFLSLTAYAALVLSHSAYGAAADIKRTGLQVAMARRADAALAALTPAQQAIARRIFVRLVQFGEGRADTRRQQPVTALCSDSDKELFEQTLSHLTDKRLLTLSGAETGPGRKVDIAHEALISGWSTLRQLLNERQIAEQTRRRLEDKADEWVRLGRGSGGLLDAAELPEAERWLWSPDAIDLGYAEALSALVLASRTAIERAEQAQARVNKLLSRGTLALGILLIIAVGFAWYAWHQKGKAQTNEKIALARQLAAQSRNQLKSRFDLSLLLSLESHRFANTVEGKSSLLDGLQLHPYLTTFLHAHTGMVQNIAFSFDGKTLAAGSGDNILLWDMATRRQLGAPLAMDKGPVHSVAFSPDGKILVSSSGHSTIRLWDMATRQPLGAPLTGHTAPVEHVVFSPDGKTLASGSDDRTVRLWDVATRQLLGAPLTGHTGSGGPVVFSPDGKMLASADGKAIILWDMTTDQPFAPPLAGHTDLIRSLAFSPDGKTLGDFRERLYCVKVDLLRWFSRFVHA